MSGPLILAIVAAVAFAGLGLHVVSLHLHRLPLDSRRPGSLLSARSRTTHVVNAVELRRLVSVVSLAIVNDPSARAELQGVLDELGAEASPFHDAASGRRNRQRRSERIEEAVADLERRWRVEPAAGRGTDAGAPEDGDRPHTDRA